MKPTKNQIEKWVKALESGKYIQGEYVLQNENNEFCCLGVACDIFIPKKKKRNIDRGRRLYGVLPENQPYAPKWLKEINSDVDSKIRESLVYLNDYYNFSFSEIATVLELLYIHKALD